MESLLFGCCLIAVIWLVMWVERDRIRPSRRWWPFAMKDFESTTAAPITGWRAQRQRRDRG